MNLRLALYEWIATHGLDAGRGQALLRVAGLENEPPVLARRLWPVVGVVAAALVGLGVILWLAANWNDLGRMGRFALLQGAILALGIGAVVHAGLRSPLGLLAMLLIGGLFAYFGQTYQTGADPWQLFAVWAVLALPLCLAARSDVLWAPWALVAMTGISMWIHAHIGHRWRVEPQDLDIYAMAWLACGVVIAALGRPFHAWTGAGAWAVRTAGTLTVAMVTLAAVGALFHRGIAPHYGLALLLLGAAAGLLAQRRWFEIFLLSAVALGLNVLLVGGVIRFLFTGGGGDFIGHMLLTGLFAAGLLAVTVSLITRLARRHAGVAHG